LKNGADRQSVLFWSVRQKLDLAKEFRTQLEKMDAQEKALVRKLDLRLLPFLSLLFLFNFLDRANLGNVHTTMIEDLGITEQQFSLCIGIFFISYMFCEIPSNLILKKVGPSRWLPFIIVCWGTFSTCMVFISNFAGLVVCRALLGIMEAGFTPGVVLYLTYWYKNEEQAVRQTLFFLSGPCATAISGILAFYLLQLGGHGGLKGWQWVFLIEGIPSILLGITAYFFLPDYPQNAKNLTEDEKRLAMERLGRSDQSKFKFNKKEFFGTLIHPQIWLFSLNSALFLSPFYSAVYFLPAIVESFGVSPITSNLMITPIFLVTAVSGLAFAVLSDRKKERPLHIVTAAVISFLGFLGLGLFDYFNLVGYAYASCFVAVAGIFPATVLNLSWLSSSIEGNTARAVGIAMVICLGDLGVFFSKIFFLFFK